MVGIIFRSDDENELFEKHLPRQKLTASAPASSPVPNRLSYRRMKAATRETSNSGDKEKQNLTRNIPRKPPDTLSEKVVSATDKELQSGARLKSSLIDSRDYNSFCRRVGNTVEYLRPYFHPEELSIPEEIVRLSNKIDRTALDLRLVDSDYYPDTVWEDAEAFLKRLEDAMTAVKAATAELRHYIPARLHSGHSKSPSLDSLESILSEQEMGCHMLKVGVQSGYEVVQKRFNDYVKLVRDGIQGEPIDIECSTLKGITSATQMISLLNSIVEFETLSHGLDKKQFTLAIDQQLLKERQQSIIEMFLAVCRHLIFLQETLFLMEHLYVKGSPSIDKIASMAQLMKKFWREAFVVMDRMIQTCPMFTEVAHEYYGRLLWHAASLTASMQDVNDLQQFLENGTPISYDAEIVHDMIKSQLWLLSCVEHLLKLTSRLTRRMKIRPQKKTLPMAPPALILMQDLKKVMYDLVMTTIGRSSWMNSYADQSSMSMLNALLDQGARTIAFVFEYNKSHISIQCDKESTVQDVSLYSGMVCATNVLRNGVLQLHSLIQRPTSISEESEDMTMVDDIEGEDSDTIKFHRIPGIRRLQTKISIKPHPLSLEGSTEFDFSSHEAESKAAIRARGTSLTSPWEEASESETPPVSPFGQGPPDGPVPHRRYSSGSIELCTGFRDVEDDDEVDSDVLIKKESKKEAFRDFSLIIPVKSPSHADRSPFESQQPPEPPSAVSGWDSAPLASTNASSKIPSVVSSGRVKDVLAVDLIPGPIIGKGSEGHVLKMSYHTTPVAVKIMNHTSLRTRERFKQETKILSKLSPHANIVNFVGRCKDLKAGEENTADLVMVMEFCELGNLYKIISEANYIRELHAIGKDLTQFKEEFGYLLYSEWSRRLQVACDIAAGAAHMHQNDIVHRDLTSFNVVLKKGEEGAWISKICDFERSRHVPHNENIPRSSMLANSPAWSAPEVLREDPYSVQADVFSLGVILWELWSLEEPWKYDDRDVRNPMMIIPMVGNGARLKFPAIAADTALPHLHDLKALIEACWNEDPSQRPTMYQVHQQLLEMKDKLAH